MGNNLLAYEIAQTCFWILPNRMSGFLMLNFCYPITFDPVTFMSDATPERYVSVFRKAYLADGNFIVTSGLVLDVLRYL
jgi:hypothetical protein